MSFYQKFRKTTGIDRCRAPKKIKKIDRIVRGVFIYWIAFVSVAWVTYWIKDSVPDTLIQYGLGGGAAELIVSGFIEIARDKKSKKEEDL